MQTLPSLGGDSCASSDARQSKAVCVLALESESSPSGTYATLRRFWCHLRLAELTTNALELAARKAIVKQLDAFGINFAQRYYQSLQLFTEDPRTNAFDFQGSLLKEDTPITRLDDAAQPYYAVVTKLPSWSTGEVSQKARVPIDEFLKAKGWWTSELPTPRQIFKLGMLPRIGRTQELQAIWECLTLNAQQRVTKAGRAMLHFRATPGVGQSFFLSELMKKQPSDIPEHCQAFAAKVGFLVLNFDSFQATVEGKSELFELCGEIPIVLRLVYNVCCAKHVLFEDFVREVTCSVRLELLTVESTWPMLRAQLGSERVVVLVDAVERSHKIHKYLHSEVWRCLCMLMSRDSGVDVLRSSFYEFLFSPSSMVLATSLPLLPGPEVRRVIEDVLPVGGHTLGGRPVSKATIAAIFASVSGGNARALEHLLRNVQDGQQSIRECITGLARNYYSSLFCGFSSSLLHVILRGDMVNKTETVWGFRRLTYEDLVAYGLLIDSSDGSHSTFVPALPELYLRAWNASLSYESEFAKILYTMLLLKPRSRASDFEVFHVLWERMIRHCRGQAEFKAVTLLQLYRNPKTRDNPPGRLHNAVHGPAQAKARHGGRKGRRLPLYEHCHVAAEQHRQLLEVVLVDGSSRLKYERYRKDFCWAGVNLVDHANTCFQPNDTKNPGWDQFIIFSANNAHGYLVVFYEERSFDEHSGAVFSQGNVASIYQNCDAFARHQLGITEFAVVFICKGIIRKTAITSAPSNCIFIDTEHLQKLYGPTMMTFLENSYNIAVDMVPFARDCWMSAPDAQLLKRQRELNEMADRSASGDGRNPAAENLTGF